MLDEDTYTSPESLEIAALAAGADGRPKARMILSKALPVGEELVGALAGGTASAYPPGSDAVLVVSSSTLALWRRAASSTVYPPHSGVSSC